LPCRFERSKRQLRKAVELLKKKGIERAEKKSTRETAQGLVESYIHQTEKSEFWLKSCAKQILWPELTILQHLLHESRCQIAAMNPKDVTTLLKQEYIRDGVSNN